MTSTNSSRPSNGGATVPTHFFPDKEALYEAASSAARATGRRHVTVAFFVDYVLDQARAKMTRASRRRFDRGGRAALKAEIVAQLSPEEQRNYHAERALMKLAAWGPEGQLS